MRYIQNYTIVFLLIATVLALWGSNKYLCVSFLYSQVVTNTYRDVVTVYSVPSEEIPSLQEATTAPKIIFFHF